MTDREILYYIAGRLNGMSRDWLNHAAAGLTDIKSLEETVRKHIETTQAQRSKG